MNDKPKNYSAWVIERRNPLRYWDGISWSSLIEDAVKFRFQEDAEAVMENRKIMCGIFGAIATEHQWL